MFSATGMVHPYPVTPASRSNFDFLVVLLHILFFFGALCTFSAYMRLSQMNPCRVFPACGVSLWEILREIRLKIGNKHKLLISIN
jgi:hypothetical protein